MDNDEPRSGSTSPTGPSSTISDATPAEGDYESAISVTTAENESTVSAATAFVVPPAPANTPATLSVVDAINDLHLAHSDDALARAGATGPAPGSSEISNPPTEDRRATSEGKAHLRAPVRSDLPLRNQLFKTPPKLATKARRKFKIAKKVILDADRPSTPKPTEESATPPTEHVHEHSVWGDVAREDLANVLVRAKQYAEDMFENDESKSTEEYYSELLAEVIKKGPLEFDASFLK